jgi:light-regulated signal transduction histidine kinase (bacteriophytochrome)
MQAESKGLELATEFHASLLREQDVFVGDTKRLRQIFWNLLGNAIKFTSEGYIKVKVDVEQEQQQQWQHQEQQQQQKEEKVFPEGGGATWALLRFEVEDTGIGLSEEAQEKLFSEFYQANSRSFEGTGWRSFLSRFPLPLPSPPSPPPSFPLFFSPPISSLLSLLPFVCPRKHLPCPLSVFIFLFASR